jgi:hypothetical protein
MAEEKKAEIKPEGAEKPVKAEGVEGGFESAD